MLSNGNGNGASRNGKGSGSMGFVSKWVQGILRRNHPAGNALNAFRRLALQLHHELGEGEGSRSVLLVTPTLSNVCAHGSIALAACMAEELNRPILLIDGCARDPQATHLLGCDDLIGVSDVLRNKLRIEDHAVPTSQQNVFFLPAGAGRDGSASPDEMGELLRAAERRFGFIVVCGSSVLDDSVSLALAPFVGRVLLLVVENETSVDELDAAQDTLAFCKARKVGLVLTTVAHARIASESEPEAAAHE